LRTADGALGSVSATIDDFQIVPAAVAAPAFGSFGIATLLIACGVVGLRRLSSSEP
jgi:hypothetical protein